MLLLPVATQPADPHAAGQALELLGRAVLELRGARPISVDGLGPEPRAQAEALLRKCGQAADCRERLAQRLGARAWVATLAEDLSGEGCQGLLLDLEVVDAGSGQRLRRVSRSLSGPPEQQVRTLREELTAALFPERLLGRVRLRIEPAGADVFLNDRPVATGAGAELLLERVPVGRQTVRLARAGYSDFLALVEVPFEGTVEVEAHLKPLETP